MRRFIPVSGAGFLIALLGAWAFFVPLVGPYFDFGFHTDDTWVFSETHWSLSLGPGLAAMIAGLLMIIPSRVTGSLVSALALLAGAWLVLGPSLYPLWQAGEPIGPLAASDTITALLWVGYYYGTGALILYLAALGQGIVSAPVDRRTVPGREHDRELVDHEEHEPIQERDRTPVPR